MKPPKYGGITGARASVIETFDGREVMVPNEDFITSRVSNLTYSSNVGRIDIPVGVSYGTDLKKAHALILEAAQDYEGASKAEEYVPTCWLRSFGDSSVNFLLVFWIDDVSKGRWQAQSDVMFRVWDALKENDIEIPFPQRDLHLKTSNVPLTAVKDEAANKENAPNNEASAEKDNSPEKDETLTEGSS